MSKSFRVFVTKVLEDGFLPQSFETREEAEKWCEEHKADLKRATSYPLGDWSVHLVQIENGEIIAVDGRRNMYKMEAELGDWVYMIYPQYENVFRKGENIIPSKIWEVMQQYVAEKIAREKGYVAPFIREHWKNIVNGVVPFGYSVMP